MGSISRLINMVSFAYESGSRSGLGSLKSDVHGSGFRSSSWAAAVGIRGCGID